MRDPSARSLCGEVPHLRQRSRVHRERDALPDVRFADGLSLRRSSVARTDRRGSAGVPETSRSGRSGERAGLAASLSDHEPGVDRRCSARCRSGRVGRNAAPTALPLVRGLVVAPVLRYDARWSGQTVQEVSDAADGVQPLSADDATPTQPFEDQSHDRQSTRGAKDKHVVPVSHARYLIPAVQGRQSSPGPAFRGWPLTRII
jgi:hypothetical protein